MLYRYRIFVAKPRTVLILFIIWKEFFTYKNYERNYVFLGKTLLKKKIVAFTTEKGKKCILIIANQIHIPYVRTKIYFVYCCEGKFIFIVFLGRNAQVSSSVPDL